MTEELSCMIGNEELLNQNAVNIDDILVSNAHVLSNTGISKTMYLVKIEDKTFCIKLKEKLNQKYNAYLYNADTKEEIIGGDGIFELPECQEQKTHKENNIQIISSTSAIQAGQ